MSDNNEQIKKRSLALVDSSSGSEEYSPERRHLDFSKIRVGAQTLEDAVLSFGSLSTVNPKASNKCDVLRAIDNLDYETMREISDFWWKTSGIYSRICKYAANLYRYDWLLTPYIKEDKNPPKDKILKSYHTALTCLDNFNVKRFLGEAALKVIRYGAYYGYIINNDKEHVSIQELPIKYCRSRFSVNGRPVIEFNMKYFTDNFRDPVYRVKILKVFPKDFQRGFVLYQEGKLPPEVQGDSAGWYALDIDHAFRFTNSGEEIPMFIATIPHLIDLDQAQELDRRKMAQQLVKIIIQQLPVDKNGDLVFDPDEAKDLHNNAVQMLGKAIGVDVLTTFADAKVEDLADRSSVTSVDELAKVERSVYNSSGVSQNLFNTDGNLALEKTIVNDESALFNLLLQFEDFLNMLIEPLNTNSKYYFKVQLLTTTAYNYKDLAKQYKEQTTLGYSKLLPQIALGQSQSSVLANAFFETQVLDLVNLFIPPVSSNTMSSDALNKNNSDKKANNDKKPGEEEKKPGRKQKPDDEKSDKTMANIESMS